VNSIAKEIRIPHALTMFVVTEAQAAAIRTAYEQRGEFSAAVETPAVSRHYRQCAREGMRADDRQLEASAKAAAHGESASRQG
jgi:hypothetical protein